MQQHAPPSFSDPAADLNVNDRDEVDPQAAIWQHVAWQRVAAALGDLPESALIAVAFSGGADSAFVLAAGVRVLGARRVVAVTAVSPAVSAAELEAARAFAAGLGVRHLTPDSDELSSPEYVANSPARCFHCKTEVIAVVRRSAAELSPDVIVVTGTNADDLRDPHRPGIAAARALGARTPLAAVSKAEVRAMSRALGLPTADKPAQPCLSSRIAFGVPVTAAGLRRVERAEAGVRQVLADDGLAGDAGLPLRVRDLGGDHARVEVDEARVAAVREDQRVEAAVIAAGFVSVTVTAFRSGSLHELPLTPT